MTGVGTPALATVFARDASLSFLFFVAFSLMAVLGVRFGLYAYWNLRATDIGAQRPLWVYLMVVGFAAALYGLLGGVEAATAVALPAAVETPYRDGVLLGFLLVLALAMREIYDNDALSNTDGGRPTSERARRVVETAFAVVVSGAMLGAAILGSTTGLTVVEGVGALVVAAYGLSFGRRQLGRSSVRGTMIDSVLRHLLPVATFGVLVLLFDLSILLGLSVEVTRHVQVVFVIMTATALMTATIKLRQNVTGF